MAVFFDQDACEAAAEAYRTYQRTINPPREFEKHEDPNEPVTAVEGDDLTPKVLGDKMGEGEDRLSPELQKELAKFEVDMSEFRRTHVEREHEFRETPDLWTPDKFNPAQPMTEPEPLSAKTGLNKIVWTLDKPMSAKMRERLREEMEFEAEDKAEQAMVARINEMPKLLQMAGTVDKWAALRCEQLILCGLKNDAAIARAVDEAGSGCLGHVKCKAKDHAPA